MAIRYNLVVRNVRSSADSVDVGAQSDVICGSADGRCQGIEARPGLSLGVTIRRRLAVTTWLCRAQLAGWHGSACRMPGGLRLDCAAQSEQAVGVPGSHLGRRLRRSASFAGVPGAGAAGHVPTGGI